MEISPEKLQEFIDLHKREYGEDITRDEALERGLALVQLVKLTHLGNEDEHYGTN